MNVLRVDVDVVEEVLVHEVPIGAAIGALHWEVFVEIESYDVGKA